MSDLKDFLRERGFLEEAVGLMEEQKIDSDVIAMMDDATLANYILRRTKESANKTHKQQDNNLQDEEHTGHLIGAVTAQVGGHDVLVRARLVLADGVTMQVTVRSGDENVVDVIPASVG